MLALERANAYVTGLGLDPGRWIRGENDLIALDRGCWIQSEVGEYVCQWIEKHCYTSDGDPPGQPFRLMDWQRNDVIMPLFSWFMLNSKGRPVRRFRRAKIFIPIRNGKTVFMAALAWYLLLGDFHLDTGQPEPSSRVFSAANDKEQAAHIFREMAGMIRYSDAFRGATVLTSKKQVDISATSYYRAFSADAKTTAGYNGHIIIDEICLFNEAGRKLREELRGRGENRLQPIEAMISRAGEDVGVGFEEYEQARKVKLGPSAGGIEDITTLPVIFEADPKCDIADPEQHRKSNPSLGTLIDPRMLMNEAIAAKQSPRTAAHFRMHRLNIWGGASEPWLDAAKWAACAAELDEAELLTLQCCGGLDLSSTTDLTAWVLIWRRKDGTLIIRPRFWLPADAIEERVKEDGIAYDLLAAREDVITLTPGNEINFMTVAEQVDADWKKYKIHRVGFDRWKSEMILPFMKSHFGIGDATNEPGKKRGMVAVEQTIRGMTHGCKLLEDSLKAGKIIQDGNPIMGRHVASCRVASDGNNNIKPMKCDGKKRRMRIDGVAAAVNAATQVFVMPEKTAGTFSYQRIV